MTLDPSRAGTVLQGAIVPVCLIVLLAMSGAAQGTGDPVSGDASDDGESGWDVMGHYVCDEPTLTVDSNVTVHDGGILDLRGCTLRMDSPPYVDREFTMADEGLVIRVDEGGELRLAAHDGQAAGITRADSRYGYTIRAEGNVTSLGLPDAPNLISGLEGSYQGRLALGGFSSAAHATIEHTRFVDNTGPSLFIIQGGTLDATNIIVEGRGGLATTHAGTVEIRGLTVNSTIGLFSSVSPDVRIDGCELNASFYGLWIEGSTVDVEDCHIRSQQIGVQAGREANVTIRDSVVEYDEIGGTLKADEKVMRLPTLSFDNVTFAPAEDAQAAVAGSAATLNVVNSAVPAHGGSSIILAESTIVAHHNLIGTGDDPPFNLTNPRSVTIHSNVYEPSVPDAIVTHRVLTVTVVDPAESPMANVTVRVGDVAATTEANGMARLTWRLPSVDGSAAEAPEPILVHLDSALYGERTQSVPGDASAAVIEIGPKEAGVTSYPALGVVLFWVAVTALGVRRASCRRDD